MKLDNFVIFKRQIADDLRSGVITPNEFNAYCYMRILGDPYGKAIVSLENIVNDIFKGRVHVNYCNKLLISLKSKRYIYYDNRKGRRGSFDVHFGDWILPNKTIKTLDKYFDKNFVRGEDSTQAPSRAEGCQNLKGLGQTFEDKKNELLKAHSFSSNNEPVRPSYKDNDKDIYKDIKRSEKTFNEKKLIPISEFLPNNYNEEICSKIARHLNEKHINPILSLYHKHGLPLIERAFENFKTRERKNKITGNSKGAYFQGIIKEMQHPKDYSGFSDDKGNGGKLWLDTKN